MNEPNEKLKPECGATRLNLPSYIYGEISGAERAAVDDHIGHCDSCRRDLNDMMSACSQLDAFTVKKQFLPPKNPLPVQSAAKIDDHFRQPIPGYALLEKIGKGGIGTVYKARSEKDNSIVAIKVLSPEYSKKTAYSQRFLREARAAVNLRHPNLVQGLNAAIKGHLHYCVMEYIDGESVRSLLNKHGMLSEVEALKITEQMAAALAYASANHIIHRDVKPENIMLSTSKIAKLTDLGLAKNIEGDTAVTALDSTCGTPHYMSPEAAQGSKNISGKSDVYSLGCTLFEMLTGQTPFTGDNGPEIMSCHISKTPPPVNVINPALSNDTVALITSMMQKDPMRRPTAAQVLERIQNIFRIKTAGFSFRNPAFRYAAIAAGLLLTLGIIWLLKPSAPSPNDTRPPIASKPDTPATSTIAPSHSPQAETPGQNPSTPATINLEALANAEFQKLQASVESAEKGEISEKTVTALSELSDKLRETGIKYTGTKSGRLAEEQSRALRERVSAMSADCANSLAAIKKSEEDFNIGNFPAAFKLLAEASNQNKVAENTTWRKQLDSQIASLERKVLSKWSETQKDLESLALKQEFEQARLLLKPYLDSGRPEVTKLAEEALKSLTPQPQKIDPEIERADFLAYTVLRDETIPSLLDGRDYSTARIVSQATLNSLQAESVRQLLKADLEDISRAEHFYTAAKKSISQAGASFHLQQKDAKLAEKVITIEAFENDFTCSINDSIKRVSYSSLTPDTLVAALAQNKTALKDSYNTEEEMMLGAASLCYLENNLKQAGAYLEKASVEKATASAVSSLKNRCDTQSRELNANELLTSVKTALKENNRDKAILSFEKFQKEFADTRTFARLKDEIEKIKASLAPKQTPEPQKNKLQSSNHWEVPQDADINAKINRVTSQIKNKLSSQLSAISVKDPWLESELRFNTGQFQEALQVLNRLEKQHPDHWSISSNALPRRRAEILAYLCQLEPNGLHNKALDKELARGYSNPADAPFLQITKAIPDNTTLLKKLLKELGQNQEKGLPEKIQNAAEIYRLYQHDYARAAACLEVLKFCFPDSESAANGSCDAELAKIYIKLSLMDIALNAVEDYCVNAPQSDPERRGNLYYDLGASSLATGKSLKDEKYFLRAAEAFTKLIKDCIGNSWEKSGDAYALLSEAQIGAKHPVEAAETLENMLIKTPQHAIILSGDIYARLGESYLNANKKAKALTAFQTLKDKYPDNPLVKENNGKEIDALIRKARGY